MLPTLTSDQELFRTTTARFLADRVPLSRLRKMRNDPAGFAADYWTAGAELGWTSLLVREEDGGGSISGAGAVDLTLIAYEFGRHAAPGPLVDTNIVAAALSGQTNDFANAALGELLSGAAVGACCLGAAPWAQGPAATIDIRKDGGDVVINGVARPVEAAGQAAHLLVTGRSESGLTQVLVPSATAGVTPKMLQSMDVTRRFGEIAFDNVRLPAAAVVGAFGTAEAQVARQIQIACVILAAESVGAMDAAFEMTLEWAFNRYTFGRALASYQALKHRFANMKAWLETSHALGDEAAAALAAAADSGAEIASAAKVFIGEQGVELMQECVQLHGGIGVTYEHDLHFYLRRVTLDRMLYGTPAEHRQMLAEAEVKRGRAA